MIITSKHLLLTVFLFVPTSIAVRGISESCCNLAKSSLASLNNTSPAIGQNEYICGQKYADGTPPAPRLAVPVSWCRNNCWGYSLYTPTATASWGLPLVQFILPAVIFSMTVPRRLGAHAPHMPLWLLLVSLVVDALILILDTAAWVFTIMMATAPFILSGLFEVIIDYKITRWTAPDIASDHFDRQTVVDLLTAVLAGNLGIEGVPANPQVELRSKLLIVEGEEHSIEKIKVGLRGMLDGQTPFGVTVGAPVLLYVGSFIYSLATLNGARGDTDTARALAFGIWWMTVVHVSSVSGSLLASNNPSTAATIYGRARERLHRKDRYQLATERPEWEDELQAKTETFSRLPLAYKARYEPVWMWTRGKNKAAWLRGTTAWTNDNEWFKMKMTLSGWSWILLTSVSYFLVLIPCALAFWLEYATPPVGLGCRALTVLIYALTQFVFVILSAWSHFKAVHEQAYWERHSWLDRLRRKWIGIFVALFFLIPALIGSAFTTFAGTLMQITGIYQNCLCAATFPPHSTVTLSSDTKEDRDAAWVWVPAGYSALAILLFVTYFGWWCQRFLRDEFMERVRALSDNLNYLPAKAVVHAAPSPMQFT